jgi:disulfide bond formation protein DsbB
MAAMPAAPRALPHRVLSYHAAGLAAAVAAAIALGIAIASERWGGLVPCALCLVERWPYRIAAILGLAAAVLPPKAARAALELLALTMLAGAVFAAIHVGVEFRWWPSPLPECAAPVFSGGSIAERLAHMPAAPAKPCDDPSYLVPGLPLSMAAMNLIFAGALAIASGWIAGRRPAP